MCVVRGCILNLLTIFSQILSKCLHKDILFNSKSGQPTITGLCRFYFIFFIVFYFIYFILFLSKPKCRVVCG